MAKKCNLFVVLTTCANLMFDVACCVCSVFKNMCDISDFGLMLGGGGGGSKCVCKKLMPPTKEKNKKTRG